MFKFNKSYWRPGASPFQSPLVLNRVGIVEPPFVPTVSIFLDDDFTPDEAATLPSPRTCDTIGSLTLLNQSTSYISSSIFYSGSTGTVRAELYSEESHPDTPGIIAAFLGGSISSALVRCGWDANHAADPDVYIQKSLNSIPTGNDGDGFALYEITAEDPLSNVGNTVWIAVMREGNGYFTRFVRSLAGNWYVLNMTKKLTLVNTLAYPGFRDSSSSYIGLMNRMVVGQLEDAFSTSFGWAMGVLDNPVNNDQIVGPSDGNILIGIEVATMPNDGEEFAIRVREVDANNYVEFYFYSITEFNRGFGVRRVNNGVANESSSGFSSVGFYCGFIHATDFRLADMINNYGTSNSDANSHPGVGGPVKVRIQSGTISKLIVASPYVVGNAAVSLEALIAPPV